MPPPATGAHQEQQLLPTPVHHPQCQLPRCNHLRQAPHHRAQQVVPVLPQAQAPLLGPAHLLVRLQVCQPSSQPQQAQQAAQTSHRQAPHTAVHSRSVELNFEIIWLLLAFATMLCSCWAAQICQLLEPICTGDYSCVIKQD